MVYINLIFSPSPTARPLYPLDRVRVYPNTETNWIN